MVPVPEGHALKTAACCSCGTPRRLRPFVGMQTATGCESKAALVKRRSWSKRLSRPAGQSGVKRVEAPPPLVVQMQVRQQPVGAFRLLVIVNRQTDERVRVG
jgi:hypothetical protein